MYIVINFFVVFGAVIILYNLFAHDRFNEECRAVRVFRPLFTEKLADHFPDKKHADRQGYDRRIDDRRKQRAQNQHEYRYDDDLHDIQNKIHEIVREKVGKFGNIIGYADDNFTRRAVIEIVERKRLQFVKDIFSDIRNDAVPHAAETPLLVESNNYLRQSGEQKTAERKEIQPVIFIGYDRIHDKTEQQRRDHR